MAPKRADQINKGRRLSQATVVIVSEPEIQQCVGKFAADFEFCCHEPSLSYPVTIPVLIRGHSQAVAPPGTHSGTSVAPSVITGISEEHIPSNVKRASRGRLSFGGQSFVINGITAIENDNRSINTTVHEPSRAPLPQPYQSFHLLRDSEFFGPKLLVDSIGHHHEPIEQITALYMKGWRLDLRFIDILKKILPLQEHLHTLNFSYIGLSEQTLRGVVDLCQTTKNLKSVSLDGNPFVAEHFPLFIEREDSKLVHLSLRFCEITDVDADRLANALGNMFTQNWKLLTLILTGNRIGDNGAKAFARALRYNRTLVSLNLSSNFITDKGGCAFASVLRPIILTDEEIVRRRCLVVEHRVDTHEDDPRNQTLSPTGSITSIRTKPVRETRRESKTTSDPVKRKGHSSKEKRQRTDSEENQAPATNKSEQKKGKNDSKSPRVASSNARRSVADSAKPSGHAREKKSASTSAHATKKASAPAPEEKPEPVVKKEPVPIQGPDRQNPLFQVESMDPNTGQVSMRGNLVLLSLNLSRNYLTSKSVAEFLLSVQYQLAIIDSHPSKNAASMDFSGLCRLELKGMNEISIKSTAFQLLETLLLQKNPSTRFQQLRERELKASLDQPPVPIVAPPPPVSEKSRAASHARPVIRLKE